MSKTRRDSNADTAEIESSHVGLPRTGLGTKRMRAGYPAISDFGADFNEEDGSDENEEEEDVEIKNAHVL